MHLVAIEAGAGPCIVLTCRRPDMSVRLILIGNVGNISLH